MIKTDKEFERAFRKIYEGQTMYKFEILADFVLNAYADLYEEYMKLKKETKDFLKTKPKEKFIRRHGIEDGEPEEW